MSNQPEKENNLEKFPIEVYHGFNSQAETETRQKLILKLKYDLLRQGLVPDEIQLVKELEKFGYHMDLLSLRRDMCIINKENRFVYDLALYNYSSDVELVLCNLYAVIRDCDKVMEKQWTMNKIISTEEQNANGTIVTTQRVETVENPGPKIQANKVKLDAINKIANVYSGGVIDVGIALITRDGKKFAVEMKRLKKRNAELEQINKDLQDGKNITDPPDSTSENTADPQDNMRDDGVDNLPSQTCEEFINIMTNNDIH